MILDSKVKFIKAGGNCLAIEEYFIHIHRSDSLGAYVSIVKFNGDLR